MRPRDPRARCEESPRIGVYDLAQLSRLAWCELAARDGGDDCCEAGGGVFCLAQRGQREGKGRSFLGGAIRSRQRRMATRSPCLASSMAFRVIASASPSSKISTATSPCCESPWAGQPDCRFGPARTVGRFAVFALYFQRRFTGGRVPRLPFSTATSTKPAQFSALGFIPRVTLARRPGPAHLIRHPAEVAGATARGRRASRTSRPSPRVVVPVELGPAPELPLTAARAAAAGDALGVERGRNLARYPCANSAVRCRNDFFPYFGTYWH